MVRTPTLRPFDEDTVLGELAGTRLALTLENHTVIGGLYETVASAVVRWGLGARVTPITLLDEFLAAGARPTVHDQYRLATDRIVEAVLAVLRPVGPVGKDRTPHGTHEAWSTQGRWMTWEPRSVNGGEGGRPARRKPAAVRPLLPGFSERGARGGHPSGRSRRPCSGRPSVPCVHAGGQGAAGAGPPRGGTAGSSAQRGVIPKALSTVCSTSFPSASTVFVRRLT